MVIFGCIIIFLLQSLAAALVFAPGHTEAMQFLKLLHCISTTCIIIEILLANILRPLGPVLRNHLFCVLPYRDSTSNVDIQAANNTELWNFNALVYCMKILYGNTFFLFSEQQDSRPIGERKFGKRDTC